MVIRPELLRFALFVVIACIAGLGEAAADLSRAQLLRNVVAHHYVPRIAAFDRAAPGLVVAIEKLCQEPTGDTLRSARSRWAETMLAWESARAITFGPLAARRSEFRIDFALPRPTTIEKVLTNPPTTLKALEAIGAPAKGIPVLEWLLWTPPEKPELLGNLTRCSYAILLAQDIADEAHLLNTQFAALAAAGLPDKAATDAFSGLLNLALNGLEQLGMRKLERPAEKANGRTFARLLSGQTAAAWNAQWLSIRDFLVGEGSNNDHSLDALLRAEHLSASADHMRAAIDRVTGTLREAQATVPDAIKAAKDVSALRTVMVEEVAAGLKIQVQFGESDGD